MNSTITVEKVINHAIRRCGVTSPTLTPEQIDLAKNNLMFTLLDLNNRGVPIYMVEQMLLGFTPNTWNYVLSRDVYDLTNINWRQVSQQSVIPSGGVDPRYLVDNQWHSYAETTDFFLLTANTPLWIASYGICFTDTNTLAFNIETSLDGVDWTVVKSYPLTTYTDGTWIWEDIDVPPYGTMLRCRITEIEDGTKLKLRSLQFSTTQGSYEVVAARMNRDDFMSLPQKGIYGSPWNWYFQKTLDPVLMIWQDFSEKDCFSNLYHMYYVQAPIFDNLALPAKLQVPQWYVDAIIWELAAKCIWELPGGDPQRAQVLDQKAQFSLNQAETANADMGPINLIGNVLASYQRSS